MLHTRDFRTSRTNKYFLQILMELQRKSQITMWNKQEEGDKKI